MLHRILTSIIPQIRHTTKAPSQKGAPPISIIKRVISGLLRELKQSFTEKWNNYENKWLLAPLAVIFLYLSGLIAQLARSRANWIPGELAVTPSFNPLKAFFALFSIYGLNTILCLLLLTLAAVLLLSLYKEDRTGQVYDKKRKVWYSHKGTHGAAHWMTRAQQKEFFELTPITEIHTVSEAIYGITDQDEIISRNQALEINRHIAVFGASGTKKSRAFVRNQIICCAKRGESMVTTDPKAELASDTVEYLKRKGYSVKILNMVKPKDSHRYDALYGAKENPSLVNKIVDAVIANTGGGTGVGYHDYAEANLLNALIFYELQFPTNGKYPTLGGAYNLLLTCDDFDGLKAKIYACGRASRAAKAYSLFHNSSDNLKGNVINGLGSRLQILQNPDVEEIISYPDLDFEELRTKKCAYFLIISDQDASMRFISSLFFNLLFIHLVEMADFSENLTILPVNLIMDEAMNVGVINELASRVSTIRSRLVNVYIIFQDISQIENRYPGTWLSIIGNCDMQIFLGCTDPVTAKFISERSGEGTMVLENKMRSKNLLMPIESTTYRQSESSGPRSLLTTNDVLTLDNEIMLIMVRGGQMLEAGKLDYSRHPESELFVPVNIQGVMRSEVEQRAVLVSAGSERYQVNPQTGEAASVKAGKSALQKAIPQVLDAGGKPILAKRSSNQIKGQIQFSSSDFADTPAGKGVVDELTRDRNQTENQPATSAKPAGIAKTNKPAL